MVLLFASEISHEQTAVYQETRDPQQIKSCCKIYHIIIQANFFEVCSLFSVLTTVCAAYCTDLKGSELLLHPSQLYFLARLLSHLMFPTFVFFLIFIQKSIMLLIISFLCLGNSEIIYCICLNIFSNLKPFYFTFLL